MNLRRHIIHQTFNGKGCLRNAVGTHGSGCRGIGINGISLASGIWAGILKSPCSKTVGGNGVTMGCISPLAGICLHIFCKQMTFLIHACSEIILNRMTGSCIAEGFLSGNLKLYRTAAYLSSQKCIQRLIKHILLVSESTSDIRFDHPYPAPGDSQSLADHTADNMRDLRGSNYNDPSLFHIGKGNGILYMTVLDNGGLVASFHNCIRLLQAFIHVSDKKVGTGKYIVFFFKMNGRIASVHGFSGMDLHRIFLIFNLDQLQRPGRSYFILCHNGSNIIAIIADTSCKDISVRNILMSRLHRPGMSRCGIAVIRHVFKGNYLYHSGKRLCLTGINRCYDPVSNGGVKDLGNQSAVENQIICKFCSACNFFISIYSWNTFSNHFFTFFSFST